MRKGWSHDEMEREVRAFVGRCNPTSLQSDHAVSMITTFVFLKLREASKPGETWPKIVWPSHTPLVDLKIEKRLDAALRNENLLTVGDLIDRYPDPQELLKVPMMGRVLLQRLKEALQTSDAVIKPDNVPVIGANSFQ